jgi:tRNA (adenine37-N6)-methyltransferase
LDLRVVRTRTQAEIPKGLGAKHEADGVLKILPEFEAELTDIEGFSHLIVIWVFDRSPRFDSHRCELATPPSDNRPHGGFATRSQRRPNPIGLTTVELRHRAGTELQVRGLDMLDGTPISISNPTCPASRPKGYAEGGWPKLRHDRGDERAKACKAPPAPAPAMLNLPQQAWSGPAFLAIVS